MFLLKLSAIIKIGNALELYSSVASTCKRTGNDDDDVLNEDWIIYRMVRSRRLLSLVLVAIGVGRRHPRLGVLRPRIDFFNLGYFRGGSFKRRRMAPQLNPQEGVGRRIQNEKLNKVE
jgi:hypothetical protein